MRGPRPRSAFRVPRPGCWPPAAAFDAKQTRDVRNADRKIRRGVNEMINAMINAMLDDAVRHASFLTTHVVMHR